VDSKQIGVDRNPHHQRGRIDEGKGRTHVLRVAAIATAAALTMLLAPPAWPEGPRVGHDCTIVGTAGDDELRGTFHDDVICALTGDGR
jgi:hypothetical protein